MVGNRFPSFVLVAVATLLVVAGCVTTVNGSDSGTELAGEQANEPSADELDEMLGRVTESLELGNHAEALHDFVALTLLSPDSDQGRRAASELERLSNGLRLEPGIEWLAPDGSQVSGSTRELKSTGAPLPSVIATMSEGPARVAVHALSIQFSVTEGGVPGPVILVPTSEFGTATAPIHFHVVGIGEVSVTATAVVVTNRGEVVLSSEPLVFMYEPPASMFVALTATMVEDRMEPAPELAAAVASRLRPIGSVAVLDGAGVTGFLEACSGDPEAIRVILEANDAALLGIAVLDVREISQIVYQDKVYDIWKADAVMRFSLFDPVGGRSLITLSSESLVGQGGSEGDALADVARIGAEALDFLIDSKVDELRTLVNGSRE